MEAELPSHINVLELQAVKLTLQALAPSHTNVHIKVMVDNTTAATYINKMGGAHSTSCNAITKEIWLWAQARNIWLSAAYVPGSENKIADYKSRHFQDNTEWSICCQLFKKIVKAFFPAGHRFVCYQTKLSTPHFCFLEARTWGLGGGCLHCILGGLKMLCFSSI